MLSLFNVQEAVMPSYISTIAMKMNEYSYNKQFSMIPITIYYKMLMVLFGNSSKAQKFYARESCHRFQHQVKAVAALIQSCRPIIPLSIKAEQELVSCPTSFVRSGVWRYDHWLGLDLAVH